MKEIAMLGLYLDFLSFIMNKRRYIKMLGAIWKIGREQGSA